MFLSHVAPVSITTLLLWLCIPCYGQYDPFGEPPYYGEPEPPFAPYFTPPEVPPPQAQPPQVYPPFVPTNTNSNANLFNPFLLTGQQSQNQQNLQQVQQIQKQQQLLQQQLQQLQGSYPNLPSVPFQTVSPSNPHQRVDKYPFQPPTNTLGNVGSANNNLNSLSSLQQQQSFGNTLLSQQYPKLPDLPFQTISPGQVPPFNNNNFNLYKSRVELPKIRVIEFPSSEYFEYGGGKLVQPKRPNSDLYVGGVGGDVPITSKIFIECTGPNQVEWIKNGTEKKDLSVITKSFQITIPEERGPTPGSREYTYLRLGLEENISEKDAGVYLCRDRILPQNYISIRVIVPSPPPTGKPNYPFIRPKDPNTIYFSRRDSSVVLPCKIENADATISLHKHESGKLSCPFTVGDGRVSYDRFKGFIIQARSFRDLEGRYVCVGDFNGDLRLMKYKLVNSEDFTTRYVEGEAQNVIALDTAKNAGGDSSTAGSSFLAQTDSFSNSILSGLTGSGSISNLTAAGLLDPRSEFDILVADDSSVTSTPVPVKTTTKANNNKIKSDSKSKP